MKCLNKKINTLSRSIFYQYVQLNYDGLIFTSVFGKPNDYLCPHIIEPVNKNQNENPEIVLRPERAKKKKRKKVFVEKLYVSDGKIENNENRYRV